MTGSNNQSINQPENSNSQIAIPTPNSPPTIPSSHTVLVVPLRIKHNSGKKQIFIVPSEMKRAADVNSGNPPAPQKRKSKKRKENNHPDIPSPANSIPIPPTNTPLIIAISRGNLWARLIESGEYGSVAELAQMLSMDPSYVRRIIRLTGLSPNITLSILDGREPEGLSLEKIAGKLPETWEEQGERWGETG